MKHYLSTIFLLVITVNCLGEELLFSSKYSGELDGYHIVSTRTLSLMNDGTYRFRSVAEHTIGSITETSDFKLVDNQIHPLKYHYFRNIFGFKKEEWINFDWEQKTATYKRKGKPKNTYVHEIKAGMFDPSLYQLQLQRDAWLSDGTFDNGQVVYDVIKHRKLKHMPFEVLQKETLSIANKNYTAIKVEIQRQESARLTTVWLVPELNYQIGKIIHKDEDGDTYEIQLEDYSFNDKVFDAIYPKKQQHENESHEQ